MPRIIVTVKVVPEGNSEPAFSWDLGEATVMRLMPLILPIADPAPTPGNSSAATTWKSEPDPTNMAPPMRVIDYVDQAFTRIGKPKVTIHELVDQMLADGWETKSKSPVGVVATSMRDAGQFTYTGDGWVRVKPASTNSQKPVRITPKKVGPGLRQLIINHVQEHGPATLSQIETSILSQYPGEAKSVSVGLAARNLVSRQKLQKNGDHYSLPF